MNFVTVPLVAGILGTIAMTLLLYLPSWLGWRTLNVVRPIGTLVLHDHNRERALLPGLVVHFVVGIFFAYLYLAIFYTLNLPLSALKGAQLGCFHGAVVAFLVRFVLLEHHPLERYHDDEVRGRFTSFALVIAHVIYGLIVGKLLQVSNLW